MPDIGRIGYDDLKPSCDIFKQISLYKGSLQRKPSCIFPCNYKRLFGKIASGSLTVIGISEQAQQNTPGACTQIQNVHSVMKLPHDLLHQDLCILPGDQHIFIDLKAQPHKFLVAQNMLKRDMPASFAEHLPVLLFLFLLNLCISMYQKIISVCSAYFLKHQPCIQLCLGYSRIFQLRAAFLI